MASFAGITMLLIILVSGLGIVFIAAIAQMIYKKHVKRNRRRNKLWVRIIFDSFIVIGLIMAVVPASFFCMIFSANRQQEMKSVERAQNMIEEANTYDEENNTVSTFVENNVEIEYRLIATDSAAGSKFYKLEKSVGGKNWTTINSDPFSGNLGKAQEIVFFTEDYGYISLSDVSGTHSEKYVTYDGGISFSKTESPDEGDAIFSIDADEKSQWEKGYNLPVDSTEEQEAETELEKIITLIGSDFVKYYERDGYDMIIPNEVLEEKQNILSKNGYVTKAEYVYSNLKNWEYLDTFLKGVKQGKKGEISFVRLQSSGLILRETFKYDGNDIYLLSAGACINIDGKYIQNACKKTRIKYWRYTDDGWFCYELCVPEYPEVTEALNGNVLLRVKPISEENRVATEKYVYPLSYKGNNILCSNWSSDTIEKLDFTGIYEYLYAMEYGERFEFSQDAKGIEESAFESLIMKYLPVSAEQIRECAVFDEVNHVYPWAHLGCGNYTPDSFGTSYPEVINMQEHTDGTVTLTINAVCDSMLNEAVITHKLTIKKNDDGSFVYLQNEILDDGENRIPEYQYRLK